ncbi:MAG TPA: hypothetical protein VD948_05655 [Rhodothermales bacterium]|nr:hypothetical protein [Rhodothermales bacterium]
MLSVLPDTLTRLNPPDHSFEGFSEDAFAVLEALRQAPHVEAYRREKARIDAAVMGPFRRYRDDLVVNSVLPSSLPWETEKNVFSRLLKNDFGAGGCHHHIWLSFYRMGRRSLTDPQLVHSLDPDGFTVGLYAGDHYGDYFARLKARVASEPTVFASLLSELLGTPGFHAYAYTGGGASEARHDVPDADAAVALLPRARGFWVRTRVAPPDVLTLGPSLVPRALDAVDAVWSLYRYYAEAAE